MKWDCKCDSRCDECGGCDCEECNNRGCCEPCYCNMCEGGCGNKLSPEDIEQDRPLCWNCTLERND